MENNFNILILQHHLYFIKLKYNKRETIKRELILEYNNKILREVTYIPVTLFSLPADAS